MPNIPSIWEVVSTAIAQLSWRFGSVVALGLNVFVPPAQAAPYSTGFTRYLYEFNKAGQIQKNGVFATPIPRFQDLKRDHAQIQSYEAFLNYLFDRAPSFRRQYVLLHRSPSLQLASTRHPRVLLFDGGVVYALSEHPDNRQTRVEMLEVDPLTRDIEMHELIFEAQGVRLQDNPTSCASCHGTPAKPLWDPYDFWPNAFGSFTGTFSTQQEADAYQALRKDAKSSPLLSRLSLPNKMDSESEAINGLTYFLSQIHFANWWKRTLELLDPELSGFRYPLLALLNNCYNPLAGQSLRAHRTEIAAYFPKGALNDTRFDRLLRIQEDFKVSRQRVTQYLTRQTEEYFPKPRYLRNIDHERLSSEIETGSMLRWILDMAGVNASNLTTSLIGNDYRLSMPTHFQLDLLNAIYDVRPDLFSGLTLASQDLFTGQPGWLKLDCAQLRKKAQTAAIQEAPSQWQQSLSFHQERPVISRCAKCHVERMDKRAPKIPFYDSAQMSAKIRQDLLGEKILARIRLTIPGQMPPGHPLSPQEISSLQSYVESLQ